MGRPGTWPKGVSGNPHGRPPSGFTMAEILRDLLDVEVGDRQRKVTVLERVVELAMEGVEWAVKMVMAYTDGPPTARIAQLNISAPQADYSNLTDDELREAARLARKAGKVLSGSNGDGSVHG